MNRKNICEICTLIMGQSPDSKSYNKDKNGIPFYQGNADFGEEHPTPTVWCTAPKKIARKGDILISVRAPIGDMNIANEDCCIGRGLAAIRLNKSDIVDINYLYHYLSATVEFLQEQGTGSTFKAINKTTLEGIEIPCPSIEKQKNIAKLIIEIKTSIQYKKAELFALNELVKSRFIEMFGDIRISSIFPNIALENFAQIGSSKRVHAADYVESGVPFYRSKEIIELGNGQEPSVELFISKKQYESIKKTNGVPCKGDILMSAVGTIGKMWIVDGRKDFYYKDGNIISIHSEETNPIYLKEALANLIDDFKSANVAGSAYSALTIVKLKKMTVPMPPMSIQNEFADFVKLIDKSEFIVQKQIDDLQELLDSKMDEYFG